MPQTMLAFLALFSVTTFTLSQLNSVVGSYSELVDDELETAATGVAMHVLEMIGNRSFDSRTTADEVNSKGMPVGAVEFSVASYFGAQAGCDLDEPFKDVVQCVDIDDAHMPTDQWQDVPFRLKDGKNLPFEVNVQVFYIDPSNLDSPLPDGETSLHKKVVVKIRSDRHVKQNRYHNGFVRLERVFSYDKRRAENRLFEKYGELVIK